MFRWLKVVVLVFVLGGLAMGLRLWAAPAGKGETVLLVDGTKLRGRVVALDEEGVTIETAEGKRQVPRGDVIYVAFADWVELNAFGLRGNDYINYDHGFRFGLPPRSWQVEYRVRKLAVVGNILEMYDQSRALFLLVAIERVKVDLDQGKAAWLAGQKQNVPGFQVLSEERVQVSERPAYRIIFTATVQGMHFKYNITLLATEDTFFRIVGWTMAENYEALEEAIEPLLKGFQLLK